MTTIQYGTLSTPYLSIAKRVAKHITKINSIESTLKIEKQTLWKMFKSAVKIAKDNNHDAIAMRAGLELACSQSDIPAGSFRSYVATVEHIAIAVDDGRLSIDDVGTISVSEARKLRLSDDAKELKAIQKELMDCVKGWGMVELQLLIDVTKEMSSKPNTKSLLRLAA